jgi:hypothetical protein
MLVHTSIGLQLLISREVLMNGYVQEGQTGWGWEIVDQEDVYLRSIDSFVTEQDARDDLYRSSHLIIAQLTIH